MSYTVACNERQRPARRVLVKLEELGWQVVAAGGRGVEYQLATADEQHRDDHLLLDLGRRQSRFGQDCAIGALAAQIGRQERLRKGT